MADPVAFTAHQLAERWQVTLNHVYLMLGNRKIIGFKVGGAWRISAAEVYRIESGLPAPVVNNQKRANPWDKP